MRKINRRAVSAPPFLSGRRVREARTVLRRHYTLPDEQRGVKRAPVDFELLTNPDVKEALREVFGEGCAYCEDPISPQTGALDHFRPIASADDGQGKTSTDHYGWFAYEWENLLLLCPACQQAKRNLFPTERARAPMLCSWEEAGRSEAPFLLDPCIDDPLRHLALAHDGTLVARSQRGDLTSKLVDLNRTPVVSARSEVVEQVLAIFDTFLANGDGESLHRLVRDLRVARPGAHLLCIRTICDFLPARYARMGRNSAGAFQRNFDTLLSTLELRIWRMAMDRYRMTGAETLRNLLLPTVPESEHSRLFQRNSSARVSRISIRNFKGIDRLDLEVSAGSRRSTGCMMLLGENSTGKSSVLQAVCLALARPDQRRQLGVRLEDFISRERSGWEFIGDKPAQITLELDIGESVSLVFDADAGVSHSIGEFDILVLAYGAHRIFRRSGLRAAATASRTLFSSLAPIADPTEWLRKSDDSEFRAVARALNEVLALKQEDHISRDAEGNVQVKAHGRTSPIERMSDGYRSLFSMAVDIMRRMVERWGTLEEARGIVLIDEVETHLHPRWKMQVMGALRRSMPQVQFIVTTHDPLCLRGMLDGEVQVLVRNEQDVVEALIDLPSVQGLRAEQLLTSEYFGLASTTDPGLESLLEEYAKAVSTRGESSSEATKVLLDDLARQISRISPVGDEPGQQIVAEAMARYLSLRTAEPLRAKGAREDAVRAVLEVLDRQYSA